MIEYPLSPAVAPVDGWVSWWFGARDSDHQRLLQFCLLLGPAAFRLGPIADAFDLIPGKEPGAAHLLLWLRLTLHNELANVAIRNTKFLCRFLGSIQTVLHYASFALNSETIT